MTALLPSSVRIAGEITLRRIVRLLVLYVLIASVGSFLFLFSNSNSIKVFGLGLILPGGGFFAYPDLLASQNIWLLLGLISSLILFVSSLGVWFGTGNILAPPIFWLATSMFVAFKYSNYVNTTALFDIYIVIGSVMFFCLLAFIIRLKIAQRQRQLDNALLLEQQSQITRIFKSTESEVNPEMSLADLKRLRFALDRALQPVAEFNGFEWLDQFQTAAVRYQINTLGYGIAIAQAQFTPAFHGYLRQAQINLLRKQAQHKVWSYWKLENLWGNLRFNPDPLSRDNIMFTGFVGLQMALFAASTGSDDFFRDGNLKLVHPSGKQFPFDYTVLISNLEKEYYSSDFCLVACEPNWIYPLCNMIGASALLSFDCQTGSQKWSQIELTFRKALDAEFLDGFGRYVPCRSARTGLALPAIGGVMPLSMPCYFLNAIAPDLAIRQWLLLRRKLFDKDLNFRRSAFWPIDTGNYRFSKASAYTATALAANELGDDEVYQFCMEALESDCQSSEVENIIHRKESSVWSHGIEIMARSGKKNTFRNLIHYPLKKPSIRLENLNYPDVLVAAAHTDKDMLYAVLYPGNSSGTFPIKISGMAPNQTYKLHGGECECLKADNEGNASFNLGLKGRTVVEIIPDRT